MRSLLLGDELGYVDHQGIMGKQMYWIAMIGACVIR